MAIEITESDLNQIKKVMGHPKVTNLILTDEEIKEYAIRPALEMYFRKFPLSFSEEYGLTTSAETEIDFPNETVFGVLDIRAVDRGVATTGGTSFWEIVAHQNRGISLNNQYGIKGYNPGFMNQSNKTKMQEVNSLANKATTTHRIDEVNRKVYSFCSISAMLNVTWAYYSENFSDVRYVYRQDVIHLCQSYFLDEVINIAGLISDTGSEIQLNVDDLRSKSERLYDEVREKWDEIQDVVMIRP